MNPGTELTQSLHDGRELSTAEKASITIRLSLPAILAQMTLILMQMIDAAMVGRLGSAEAASIGLVSATIWLFSGICIAVATGFTVQVGQYIGAGDYYKARNVLHQSFAVAIISSILLTTISLSLSKSLPYWLGGNEDICANASKYFAIYALSIPFIQLQHLAGGMLQVSGNMHTPSILYGVMCGLDVLFNLLLIFPRRYVGSFLIPGAGMGVGGAAIGTAASHAVVSILMLYFLWFRTPALKKSSKEKYYFSKFQLKRAARIAIPVGAEKAVMCCAQILTTGLVAPLGTTAVAANTFAITAESLCYMPGYGIESAATVLVSQSVGAQREKLARQFGWLAIGIGVGTMSITGLLLFFFAPQIMAFFTDEQDIIILGTAILHIEAFAEPLYGASIVTGGVFRGAGSTTLSSSLNFFSMWALRIPLSIVLVKSRGLQGIWLAMCIELCVRGILFLGHMCGKRW